MDKTSSKFNNLFMKRQILMYMQAKEMVSDENMESLPSASVCDLSTVPQCLHTHDFHMKKESFLRNSLFYFVARGGFEPSTLRV